MIDREDQIWEKARIILSTKKPGANVRNYLPKWEEIQGREGAERGLTARWKDPIAGPEYCKMHLAEQKARKMHLSEELERELWNSCLKDEKDNILARVEERYVKWTCPAWVIPKKKAEGQPVTYRRVQDCRQINDLLDEAPFKMEDGSVVMNLARPGLWATSLDFKSAYNLFPIDNDSEAKGVRNPENFAYYHCFLAGGVWWRPVGMLFGAKHAPFFFTTILLPVTKAIRAKWKVDLVIYLDDVLLLHEDPVELRIATAEIADFLLDLGIILAVDKCEPVPKEKIQFLGWQWDFQSAQMFMTKERRKSLSWEIKRWTKDALHGRRVRIRDLQAIVGKLQFLKPQMVRALLYLKPLSSLVGKGLAREGQQGFVSLDHTIVGSLKWFAKEIAFNSPQRLEPLVPQGTLTTDASEAGCGATLLIDEEEFFMCEEFNNPPGSSNQREMLAVLRALQHFKPILEERGIRALTLESDNMTVVFNIMKAKSAQGPLPIVRALFSFLTKEQIRLFPLHLPGKKNTKADALSRLEWMGDYEVKWDLVVPHLSRWGIYPEIDLFATKGNHKCPKYCSADKGDQGAEWIDAFSRSWRGLRYPLIHTTPGLILACLRRIQEEQLEAIMIAPMWPSQPWWDRLKRMTQKFQVLGRGEEALNPGPWMKKRGTKLPPGWIEVALVTYVR
jgi:ribonuclease HI